MNLDERDTVAVQFRVSLEQALVDLPLVDRLTWLLDRKMMEA